jgi:hypothetical protein
LTLTASDSAQRLSTYLANLANEGTSTGDVRNSTSVLRSLIADNKDEYTGYSDTYPGTGDYLPEVDDPTVRSQLEVDDLFQEAINWMSCFGANANSYSAMNSLGLGVNFSAGGGVGIGMGVGSNSSATFGAVATAGVGFGTSKTATTSPSYTAGQLASKQGDVLFSAGVNSRVSSSALDTGYGDPGYGYASPYGGPGFGQSGFGDNGGLSFGSSFGSTGDPGYLPPSSFSQAGVADDRSDLERLLTPRSGYGSGLGGVGADASYAGAGAGSAVAVGGAVTAFSIGVMAGTLNPAGTALSPSGRRLGLTNNNPYGVPCLGGSGQSGINLLDML